MLISAVVIFLLAQFSQQVIRDESVEITQQALANMALRIDNELRQADISARLEHRTFTIDRLMIEKMIEENFTIDRLMIEKMIEENNQLTGI